MFLFDFSGLKAGKIKKKHFFKRPQFPGLKAGAIRCSVSTALHSGSKTRNSSN
jgi:hypothetical protein